MLQVNNTDRSIQTSWIFEYGDIGLLLLDVGGS